MLYSCIGHHLCHYRMCLDIIIILLAESLGWFRLTLFGFIGFCFVYMEDERDAEDAIRKLDRIEFGRKGRRLRIEWTKVCMVFLALDGE